MAVRRTTRSRPRLGASFYKAHGLGNDYLVFEEGDAWKASAAAVARVCHRWEGAGGDGIVVLGAPAADGVVRLRMFNPDGSEFERSGNGLRVLASHLRRAGRVADTPFLVEVGGDRVGMTVHGRSGGVYDVSVDMGRARIGAEAVGLDPAALDPDGTLVGPLGEPLEVVPVSVGNPHLVVWSEKLDPDRMAVVGPYLATHAGLRNGANVQLASLAPDGRCRALIWERGVGPTTASGTSACAVAVAAVHRGRDPGAVPVDMEGGTLHVNVSPQRDVVLRGPVEEVMEGTLTPAFVKALPDAGP